MKKMLFVLAGIIMAAGVSTSAYSADATMTLDVNSAYVSRGATYNDGLVLQPSLDVVKGGFDVNIWGNIDMNDYNDTLEEGKFSEIDLALYYSHAIDKLTLTGGIISYVYPPNDKTSSANGNIFQSYNELYANGTLALIDNLALGLSVYYQLDEGGKDTLYSNLGLNYTYPVNDKLSVTGGALAGYMQRRESIGESGFNEYKLSLKASYALTSTIGIGANINYVDAIDDDVLTFVDVNTYGGVTVSCKF